MTKRSRKKNAAANTEQSSKAQPSQPWYKTVWFIVFTVCLVGYAIAQHGPTMLQNLRKVPAEFSATLDQYLSWLKEDEKWTGRWSTFPEGIVNIADMKLSEGVDLKISITSKSGEIDGQISTGSMCKNMRHFDFLLLRGKVDGSMARVSVWDTLGGESVTFAYLELVREADVITVKPISGGTDWLTVGARIGKHPTSDEGLPFHTCDRGSNSSGDLTKRL